MDMQLEARKTAAVTQEKLNAIMQSVDRLYTGNGRTEDLFLNTPAVPANSIEQVIALNSGLKDEAYYARLVSSVYVL